MVGMNNLAENINYEVIGPATILTYKGKEFDYLNPTPESISLGDIAHALAQTPRYGGMCPQFYSVAQHCVLMSEQFEDIVEAKWALFHDAAETYMTDIPSPLKRILPGYTVIEQRILEVIQEKFSLGDKPDSIKEADKRMYATERLQVANMRDHTPQVKPYDIEIVPWSWRQAEIKFLERYLQIYLKK